MSQANTLIRDLRLLVLPMTMVFLLGATGAGAGACLGLEICLVTLGPPWLLSPRYDAWNYLVDTHFFSKSLCFLYETTDNLK